MKTPSTHRSIPVLAAFVSIATAIAFSLSISSGAADSPAKGAERLMQIGASTSPRAAFGTQTTLASHVGCGECKTVASKVTPEPVKGAQALTSRGAPIAVGTTHGCDGCTTTLGVTGHGKAKAQTVTHACSRPMLASASCCK